MIDSKILISVVIVLLIGGAAASYQISNTPGLWQPVTSHNPDSDKKSSSSDGTDSGSHQSSAFSPSKSSSQQSSGTGSDNVKISSSEAKAIAQQSIVQKGATAGTPTLINSNGKKIYVVPIMMNGNRVGEIYIDSQTGNNLGGAGGAP
ncbi:MAG: peptidase propeptide domain-containing protein [Euryarchaeota archaeon]|uniref:PepSY domain-containing protein n=1 Tax=Methanobacterium sp. MZD130B TaxID=3394378 RepID=UPI0009CFD88F|nr:peptidase propeptide domain-containing protein [Euryarchaeota archaeon]OPZ94183.1 MAG: hypothetical protein BWY74_00752 [Firmicutes bacterium ADurb.Bin419]HHT18275.1 peptidase propeptide domain-containing protein [Methanobacterium sp.]